MNKKFLHELSITIIYVFPFDLGFGIIDFYGIRNRIFSQKYVFISHPLPPVIVYRRHISRICSISFGILSIT